jgi:hypothetical protein
VAANDHLKRHHRGAVSGLSDAHDEPGSNAGPEQEMSRARHRHRRLASRDHAKGSARHGIARRGCVLDEARGINRGNPRADDGDEIVAKNVEGTSQCVCLGSDQAERPVTTSNCFRSELTS